LLDPHVCFWHAGVLEPARPRTPRAACRDPEYGQPSGKRGRWASLDGLLTHRAFLCLAAWTPPSPPPNARPAPDRDARRRSARRDLARARGQGTSRLYHPCQAGRRRGVKKLFRGETGNLSAYSNGGSEAPLLWAPSIPSRADVSESLELDAAQRCRRDDCAIAASRWCTSSWASRSVSIS